MAQHSAHTVRTSLEKGSGLRIFGVIQDGDTLAIEMADNQRIPATIQKVLSGRLWLEINGKEVAFDAGSEESNLLPQSPLAHTDWTLV